MSVIGRILDTLEVRTSLLVPEVYHTPCGPPKYVKMPQNQLFGSCLLMLDIGTITMGKQHENNVYITTVIWVWRHEYVGLVDTPQTIASVPSLH